MTGGGPALVTYRATAAIDGTVVADSARCVRVDVPDAAPELWFPTRDVDLAALDAADAVHWRTGADELAAHVAFDHDRVVVLLLDAADTGGTTPTPTRFPNWGDAADLVRIIDVRPDADGRFVSEPFWDWRRPIVEGSQMLGQSIVAASRRAPGRRAVAASMVFTRAADARSPYAIELDEVAGGRTFSAFATRATQGDRVCAAGTVLLDVTAPDVLRHAEPAPDVGAPADAAFHDMSVTGRELRVVGDAYDGDPDAPVGPPELDVWVRFRSLPDDPAIHAGLVAQFTGHLSIAAAMRPHDGIGQDHAHVTLSTAVNAISLSLHADVRADQWLLYHHRSTFAGDGMTHSECRIRDEAGALVGSFTVDCMVRAFGDPSRGDARTAL